MNDNFIPLDCDDDVISFEKDTFKISNLKEILFLEVSKKLNQLTYNQETQKSHNYVIHSFSSLPIGQEGFGLSEIQFHSIRKCQILRVSGKGWQKGRLKIQINKRIADQSGSVSLDFCPDEVKEPESPLDDIRKKLEANSN
ncbi:KGK domain-containing protein [Nostoc muscorum FACHB-395]|nr:KGK domain-containing protein [Desmonostoc muscorum FACHB-395]